MVVVLRRTAIRLFPGNQRVALYTNDRLGLEVSVPYEHGQIGGKKITAVMKEETHHQLFGEFIDSTQQINRNAGGHNAYHTANLEQIRSRVKSKWGQTALGHFQNAAQHYVNGDMAKASSAYQHFERHIKESVEPLIEGAIHKIHHIAKTGQDGDVVFKNGATARLSAQQALSIVKLHKALTPENKTNLENQVNGSPEEMRKVVEFSKENLK